MHQNAVVQETVPDRDILLEIITFNMRHQNLIAAAAGQLIDLAHHVAGPGLKGHFQKQKIRALQAQAGQLLHMGDPGEVQHFRAEKDLRRIRRERSSQFFKSFLPPLEKTPGRTLGGIEMGRCTDCVDALRRERLNHLQTHLHALASVVNARQYMAVEIDHSRVSAVDTVTFSSTVASIKALSLLPLDLLPL